MFFSEKSTEKMLEKREMRENLRWVWNSEAILAQMEV
jgi:hypothetical protein